MYSNRIDYSERRQSPGANGAAGSSAISSQAIARDTNSNGLRPSNSQSSTTGIRGEISNSNLHFFADLKRKPNNNISSDRNGFDSAENFSFRNPKDQYSQQQQQQQQQQQLGSHRKEPISSQSSSSLLRGNGLSSELGTRTTAAFGSPAGYKSAIDDYIQLDTEEKERESQLNRQRQLNQNQNDQFVRMQEEKERHILQRLEEIKRKMRDSAASNTSSIPTTSYPSTLQRADHYSNRPQSPTASNPLFPSPSAAPAATVSSQSLSSNRLGFTNNTLSKPQLLQQTHQQQQLQQGSSQSSISTVIGETKQQMRTTSPKAQQIESESKLIRQQPSTIAGNTGSYRQNQNPSESTPFGMETAPTNLQEQVLRAQIEIKEMRLKHEEELRKTSAQQRLQREELESTIRQLQHQLEISEERNRLNLAALTADLSKQQRDAVERERDSRLGVSELRNQYVQQIDHLTMQLSTEKTNSISFQRKLEDYQAHYQNKLREMAEATKSAKREIDENKSLVKQCLDEVEGRIERAKQELNYENALDIERIQAENKERVNGVTAKLTAASNQVKELETKLIESSERSAARETEFQAQVKHLEDEVRAMRVEQDSLAQEALQFQSTIQQGQTELSQAQMQLQELTSKNEALETENAKLKKGKPRKPTSRTPSNRNLGNNGK